MRVLGLSVSSRLRIYRVGGLGLSAVWEFGGGFRFGNFEMRFAEAILLLLRKPENNTSPLADRLQSDDPPL